MHLKHILKETPRAGVSAESMTSAWGDDLLGCDYWLNELYD